MTEICGKIAANILKSCTDPLVQNIKDRIIILNLEDIETITRNNTNKQIIEGITLVGGSPTVVGYKIEGIDYSFDASDALVKGDYGWGYDHKLVCRIFQNDPDSKKAIEDMQGGKYVIIIENNFVNRNKAGTPGDSRFEILGLDNGLIVKELTRDKSDDATKGAFVMTFGSHAKALEPHLPATFFITDEDTTATAVNDLLG